MYLHVNLCYQKHVILRNNIYSNATITKYCSQFFSKVVIISELTQKKICYSDLAKKGLHLNSRIFRKILVISKTNFDNKKHETFKIQTLAGNSLKILSMLVLK